MRGWRMDDGKNEQMRAKNYKINSKVHRLECSSLSSISAGISTVKLLDPILNCSTHKTDKTKGKNPRYPFKLHLVTLSQSSPTGHHSFTWVSSIKLVGAGESPHPNRLHLKSALAARWYPEDQRWEHFNQSAEPYFLYRGRSTVCFLFFTVPASLLSH